jgi:uncharacterized protein (DUF58 family)
MNRGATVWRPALLLVGAAVLIVGGGGGIGSATLFALGAALALAVVVSTLLTTLAARRIRVERTIAVDELPEDEPLAVAFAVRGLGRLPVRVEVLDAEDRWTPLARDGGVVELRVARRGPHRVGPSRVRVGDELGIARRVLRVGGDHELLVLPAIGFGRNGLPGGLARAGDPDPDGLRAYRPGTPMSRIHWASLARGGELQERVMLAASSGLPLVVVDTAAAADAAAVDWAARTAAGAVSELLGSGGCRVLLPGAGAALTVTAPDAWPDVHRSLARIGTGAPRLDAGGGGEIIRIDAGAAPPGPPRPRLPEGVVPLGSPEPAR